MRRSAPLFLLLGVPGFLSAQLPSIKPHGIVNAASFFAPGLPAGSIARGSIFTIFGSALGPAQGVQVAAFPLQNAFNGVTITVTQGATVVNALPLYVRQDQINALMPSNAPLGWVSVRVVRNNAFSNPSPVYVANDSVGIFTATGLGIGSGAINNFVSASNQPANSLAASAKPGQVVTMFATGLGPITSPDNQAPPTGSLPTPVEVWVGGIPASVSYSGRSPCCAGLDQVAFTVPANAPQGCWVPVEVRTSHATVSNFVSMAIDPKGAACSDPANPFTGALVQGKAIGMLSLIRTTIHEDVGVTAPVDVSEDFVTYTATQQTATPFVFAPFTSAPPPGTCTVYPGAGDFFNSASIPGNSAATYLDAGTQLQISGPGGQQSVSLVNNAAALGSYLPLYSLPNKLYLAPGNYTVSGAGGANVGAFKANLTVPSPFTWTNMSQIQSVDRTQPLTLSWSGATAGQSLAILGVDSDLPTNSSSMFVCIAPANATSFTVPAEVLSAIPATQPNVLASKSVVYLLSSNPAPLVASGLAASSAAAVSILGATVIFQ